MPKSSFAPKRAIALACLASSPFIQHANAQNYDSALTDVITVTSSQNNTANSDQLNPDQFPNFGADAANIIARIPGADALANGPLSGQVQYRGLFGSRVNLRINGQSFASGGPNLMDPPLHYAPLPLISHIEVDRGISPVRNGPGLAGGMNVGFKRVDFTDSESVQTHYDLTLASRSADNNSAVGGLIGAASETFRIQTLFSLEDGGDIQAPLGSIVGTAHRRLVYGLGLGFKNGQNEFALNARRQETGATGNPAFAMDIRYFDTDFISADYQGQIGQAAIRAHLGLSDVSHAMNNFDLRPAPTNRMRDRETFAYAETLSGGFDLQWPQWDGDIRLGVDFENANHDVTITHPGNSNFFLNNLPAIATYRTGLWLEWQGQLFNWNSELGLRNDWHEASADTAELGLGVPAMPHMLANHFNATERNWDSVTHDVMARLWRPINDQTTLRFSLARKTRAPGYLELFAWLPTPASGGLADGNTYVGDQALSAETAWIIESGFDWHDERSYLRPALYYRMVDNYIQGTPFDNTPSLVDSMVERVSAMNGDPTPLRFANVDADMYGLDIDFGHRLSPQWSLDGNAAFVRGKRSDIDDNLYRISPANLTLSASYETGSVSASLEAILIARQDHVSTTNSEIETPGYTLVNLYGDWIISDQVTVSAGISNLLNHTYRQHLAGYNRNTGGFLAAGDRLPGPERSLSIRLQITN